MIAPVAGLPLGAHPDAGGTRFAVFATRAREVAVRIDGARTVPLQPLGEGLLAAYVSGVRPGVRYSFVLDGRELPDPFARFLPDGVHGPAEVVAPAHRWRHDNVARPLAEHVVYELHVGAFSPEGTYAGVIERLRHLRELGVTAIELMPVAAFAGRRGWGYDGVALYAPFAPYGRPDELRALVDAAHGLGLAVLLDVVHNHLGPAGNYLCAYAPEYFTAAVQTPWGDAPDYGHPAMRRYVLENAAYWLESFRFDGLRLDATHAIVDRSKRPLLGEIARHAAKLGRLVIAEDERNEPALVREMGLHGIWADDFHHQVRVTLTGEQDGYFAGYTPGVEGIARAIRGGWLYEGQVYPPIGVARGAPAPDLPAEAFVYCLQNHDQVGNRALGDRLHHAISAEAWHAVSALLLFLPMTPLLFMGQEWAASTPFQYFTDHEPELGQAVSEGRRAEFGRFAAYSDPAARARIPDPQAEETFLRAKLAWAERDQGEHARVLGLYRRMLALRREDPVLRASRRDGLSAEADGDLLVVTRRHGGDARVLVVNFGADAAPMPAGRLLLRTGEGEGLGPLEAVVVARPAGAGAG